MLKTTGIAVLSAICLVGITAVSPVAQGAQKKKKLVVRQTQKNETKGQGQLAGGLVKFGEVYSLKGGLNFEILKARYSMEPFYSYEKETAHADKKLVILDLAVKNATPSNNDHFPPITLIDANGEKYEMGSGMLTLASKGVESFYLNLKPGQGYGQPDLHDPLQVGFLVPLNAKITKIMIGQPRLNKNEEVLRYLIAGSDKEADAANVIAPLPKTVADPADESGATAMPAGKVGIGDSFTTYFSSYKVTGVTTTTEPLRAGVSPEEGKQFVIVSVSMKMIGKKEMGMFYCLDKEATTLKDEDGDKASLFGIIKASSGDELQTSDRTFDPGEEINFRLVFQIGEKAKPSSLHIVAGSGYPWQVALSK